MIRILLSFVLIVGFLFPPMLKLGVMLDFYQHKEYIVKTLCINRDKPQAKCEGNCHLKKQLSKTVEQDQEKKAPAPTVKTELSPCVMDSQIPAINPILSEKTFFGLSIISYSFLKSKDFFHPPQFC